MVFLVVVPIFAGFGNYLVPLMIGARDMAFPRLNALSYWLYALGGVVSMLSWLAKSGPAHAGWTMYPPLSERFFSPGNGTDYWILAPAPPLARVARRRDQLHRHDPQHAHARDVVDAHAGLRLDDRGLRDPARRRAAGALGRADDAAARPPGLHPLLPAGAGRERRALPARVLVLRASRGLHHGAARDGMVSEILPVFSRKPIFGYTAIVVLDALHRLLLDARLGAPHVHGRHADRRSTASSWSRR